MPAREIALAITADPDQVFDSLLERSLSGGAARGIRTPDPVITNDVLYQLSYCGGPCGAFGQSRKTLAHLISGSARLCKNSKVGVAGKPAVWAAKAAGFGPNRAHPPHLDRKPRQPPA